MTKIQLRYLIFAADTFTQTTQLLYTPIEFIETVSASAPVPSIHVHRLFKLDGYWTKDPVAGQEEQAQFAEGRDYSARIVYDDTTLPDTVDESTLALYLWMKERIH